MKQDRDWSYPGGWVSLAQNFFHFPVYLFCFFNGYFFLYNSESSLLYQLIRLTSSLLVLQLLRQSSWDCVCSKICNSIFSSTLSHMFFACLSINEFRSCIFNISWSHSWVYLSDFLTPKISSTPLFCNLRSLNEWSLDLHLGSKWISCLVRQLYIFILFFNDSFLKW